MWDKVTSYFYSDTSSFPFQDLAEDDADELVFAAQLLMHQQPYQQRSITQGWVHCKEMSNNISWILTIK